MPPFKPPQGWRYLKAKLRLLNRPQALGTIAVLLVSGSVLTHFWRRQPVPSPAPSSIPATATPALTPAAPLSMLEPPSVSQPSPSPDSPVRTAAIASPTPPTPPTDLDLLNSPVLPAPNLRPESAPTRSIDRSPSSLPTWDSLAPASPTAPPADPLSRAIANPAPVQIAPPVMPNGAPSMVPPVRPYATSPPPGTTGYVLPPTLAPSPSGLPAAPPEVPGAVPPGLAVPIAPVPPGTPGQMPGQMPGQPIGSGQSNPFSPP